MVSEPTVADFANSSTSQNQPAPNPQVPPQIQPTQNPHFQPQYPLTPNLPLTMPIPPQLILLSLTQPLSVKLDSNNYLVWHNQLFNVVIAHGLEGYINGTLHCLSHHLDLLQQQLNPACTTW